MRHRKHIIALLSILMVATCFISCQRVIDVEITSGAQKLVIEGNLTDVLGTQTVTISRSVSYNSTNVFPTVSGAVVSLIDGSSGKVSKFTESTTAPGTYNLAAFKGKTFNPYTLTVLVEGKTYSASAVMPSAVLLDSLTLSGQTFGNTLVKTVSVNYHDPGNAANQYRYILYVNGVQVKRVFAENDNLTDGRAVTTSLYQREIDLNKGDKVDVEMQCIDANMFNYWDNLSNQGGNSPQDSSTPANPPSNFFNDAVLGYFSVHTVQRKSLLIP